MDKRTLEKYEREAREKNRETWYLSWALDTNQEERDKVSGALIIGIQLTERYSGTSQFQTLA